MQREGSLRGFIFMYSDTIKMQEEHDTIVIIGKAIPLTAAAISVSPGEKDEI